jgi:hypothetical protein
MAQMYHPDKMAALGPEPQRFADGKMKEINVAYQLVEMDLDHVTHPDAHSVHRRFGPTVTGGAVAAGRQLNGKTIESVVDELGHLCRARRCLTGDALSGQKMRS